MSLSEREQQALQSIEDGLTGADPRLAALLATFTRLTADEALPLRERIDAGRRLGVRPRRRMPLPGGRLPWQYTCALLWFGVTLALIALALVLGHGGSRASCGPLRPACAGQARARFPGPAAGKSAVTHPRGVAAHTAALRRAFAAAGTGAPGA